MVCSVVKTENHFSFDTWKCYLVTVIFSLCSGKAGVGLILVYISYYAYTICRYELGFQTETTYVQ